jgi:hypothetical protein
MYATVTLLATPSPLIPSPVRLSLFVTHPLVLDSQSQQGRLLFPTCPPTPTLILGIPIPHPCSTAHCTFYSARAHPHFRSCTAALHVHHSPTDTPPDADLWCCRYFCSLNLAAPPSYSSHGPCTVPLTARDFGARMCTASTNTGHGPVLNLDFPPAFAVHRSCITCAAELALPPPALSRAPSPRLYCAPPMPPLPIPCPSIGGRYDYPALFPAAASVVLNSGCQYLGFLPALVLFCSRFACLSGDVSHGYVSIHSSLPRLR